MKFKAGSVLKFKPHINVAHLKTIGIPSYDALKILTAHGTVVNSDHSGMRLIRFPTDTFYIEDEWMELAEKKSCHPLTKIFQ